MCFEERNLAKNLQKNGNFSAKFKFESVTFKMFKETLLLILSLAVISKTSQPEHINVPVSFKRIGRFATGLSYGHIRATINFNQLLKAHKNLELFLNQQLRIATSSEEQRFIETIQHQFSLSTRTINRLHHAFFHDGSPRNKRQVFAGLSLGFGFLSLGMSIYNTYEISKLHNKLANMNIGFDHVVHVLEEQDHAISTLSHSINSIKSVIQIVLSDIKTENQEIDFIKRIFITSNLLQNHNAEVSAWGRGLEALISGKLHPSLINTTKLESALNSIQTKASKLGLSQLFKEHSSVYKSAISYLATKENEIFVYIHIPFVDMDPISLYEHLPIPFQIGNLLITLHSENNVIASDDTGTFGIELSSPDLLHCHMEKSHSGNIYICPNSNLLLRNLRQTCLGSLLFGDKDKTLQLCKHSVQKSSELGKFAIQTGPGKILVYSPKHATVVETCANGTKSFHSIANFSTLTPKVGCKILSDSFLFKPQQSFIEDSDIFDHPTVFKMESLLENTTIPDLEKAYEELSKIMEPQNRKSLSDLKKWLSESAKFPMEAVSYGASFGAMIISILIVIFIAYLYFSFRAKRNPEN